MAALVMASEKAAALSSSTLTEISPRRSASKFPQPDHDVHDRPWREELAEIAARFGVAALRQGVGERIVAGGLDGKVQFSDRLAPATRQDHVALGTGQVARVI